MKILILMLLAVTGATAGDMGLAVQSAIVPGMGQMAAGRGEIVNANTWKGLALMGGFVFCAHSAFQSASRQESYAEETKTFARLRDEATEYQEKKEIEEKWNLSWDNYNNARLWKFVFTGLSAGLYGYGIVDALLFTKKAAKAEEKAAGIFPPGTELRLIPAPEGGRMEVLCRF